MSNLVDNYEYLQARRKFSAEFLHYFDDVLDYHKTINLTPSDSLSNALYTISNIALFGYLEARRSESIQNALKHRLISISCNSERVALTHHKNCFKAIKRQVLTFKDIINCPIHILKILIQPDIQSYLLGNNAYVRQQKGLNNEQSHLLTIMEKIRNAGYECSHLKEAVEAV